jgi:hypothetical protein
MNPITNLNSVYRHSIHVTILFRRNSFLHSIAPAQFLSSAHKKVHIPTLYLFHFLRLYPLLDVLLLEGRAATAWEPSKLENCCPSLNCSVSRYSPFLLSILSVSLSPFKVLKKQSVICSTSAKYPPSFMVKVKLSLGLINYTSHREDVWGS